MRLTSRSRLLASIASAIAVVLLAELGVRAVQGSLPEPVEWYDAKAQVKIEQMERLRRKERRVDFVFAGTSMVLRGINPKVFDEASPERSVSYNAGLLAGLPPIMERWVLEEVEPRVNPRVVVYGVSSIDFHARRYKRPLQSYERAPATRKGLMASLQRLCTRKLNLIRFRPILRDPKVWKNPRQKLKRKEGPVERARERMDNQGYIPKDWMARGQNERRRMRDEVLKDYEISERGTRSITRIVRTLEKRSVKMVLVSMPVPQRYSKVHPHGRRDFEAAQRHLTDLAARLNVPLIDMSASMKDRMFVDFTHLGEQGAQRFSRKLRRELHDLGY